MMSGATLSQVGDLSAVRCKVYLMTLFQPRKVIFVASCGRITVSYKVGMAWKDTIMAHFRHVL